MLYEYAIAPTIFETIEIFYSTFNHFGLVNGRLISEIPRSWRKELYYNLKRVLPDGYDSKELESKLFGSRFGSAFWRRKDCLAYNNGISWIENAKNEHNRKAFDGIIVNRNDEKCPCRITIRETIEEPDSNKFWSLACHTKEIDRIADSLSNYLKPLLDKAVLIRFVDPYLNLKELAFQRPVLLCITEFLKTATVNNPKVIQFHSTDKDDRGAKYICEGADQLWGKINPKNRMYGQYESFIWQEIRGNPKFDDRFIVTDLITIQINHDLRDDNGDGGQKWRLANLGPDSEIDSNLGNGSFKKIWPST